MSQEERLECLERENARLRAENGVLKSRLQKRGISFAPWWKRLGRWLLELPRTFARRRMAQRLAAHDAQHDKAHDEELRNHLVGADDI